MILGKILPWVTVISKLGKLVYAAIFVGNVDIMWRYADSLIGI